MIKPQIILLIWQRSHQQLADEKGLYVAKIRPGVYPQISAAPLELPVRSRKEISLDEEIDFKLVSAHFFFKFNI